MGSLHVQSRYGALCSLIFNVRPIMAPARNDAEIEKVISSLGREGPALSAW